MTRPIGMFTKVIFTFCLECATLICDYSSQASQKVDAHLLISQVKYWKSQTVQNPRLHYADELQKTHPLIFLLSQLLET